MKINWIHGISFLILIMAFIFILGFSYCLFIDGNNPVTYNGPMKVLVHDDYIDVFIDYCKYSDLTYTSYVSFVDGIIYNTPPQKVVGTEIGCGVMVRTWKLPLEMEDGIYHMEMRNEFKVNSIRTITVGFNTEKFLVNRTKCKEECKK